MSALPLRFSTLLMVSAMLAGCSPALMLAPAGLADSEPWPVTGHSPRWRNTDLSFGPHAVRAVDEGTRIDWGLRVGTGRLTVAGRVYAFELDPGPHARRVDCREAELGLRKRGYEVDASGMLAPRLACGIAIDRAGFLEVALNSRGTRFEGVVTGGDSGRRIEIRSVHSFEGSDWPSAEPVGFELLASGRPLAAVETINAGRVWLAPELDSETRSDLAAVAAALLLFRPDGGEAVDG